MAFRIPDLTPDSVEDAAAWWLYGEDEGFELWRLVPGSPVVSPNGRVLRLQLELEGDRFELALVQRDDRIFAKFDQREDPEQELPTRVFAGPAEAIVWFADKDETVFLHLELAG